MPECVALARVLIDALSLLPWLEADFQDAKERLALERAMLAAGWRTLEASTKEVRGEVEAVHAEGWREAAKAKATCASAVAEKEALSKRYEVAKASFILLQEAVTAHEAKLADRDTELERAAAEQVTERGRFNARWPRLGMPTRSKSTRSAPS